MDGLPQRLTFVTLGTRSMRERRHFYRAWGWVELDGGSDGYASFDVGGTRLALYPLAPLTDEAAPGLEEPSLAWNGVTLAINLEDRGAVERCFAAAVSVGAQPVAPPQDRAWGGYSGYVADPEGQRWELAWAPGFQPSS